MMQPTKNGWKGCSFTDKSVSVRILHVLVSRVGMGHRCDPMAPCFFTGGPAIAGYHHRARARQPSLTLNKELEVVTTYPICELCYGQIEMLCQRCEDFRRIGSKQLGIVICKDCWNEHSLEGQYKQIQPAPCALVFACNLELVHWCSGKGTFARRLDSSPMRYLDTILCKLRRRTIDIPELRIRPIMSPSAAKKPLPESVPEG